MNHDDAKQKALEHAAWLHFEGTQTSLTVEAAIEEYARNLDVEPLPDPKPEPGTFRVFDAIRWGGKPNLEPFGLEPIKFHYASAFFDPVPDREDKNYNLPRSGVIENIARNAPPGLNVGDVEHMWPGNGQAMVPAAIDSFVTMTERWQRNARDNVKFGWYSSIPRNYHDASDDKSSSDYRQWIEGVRRNKPIIDLCDFLTLSLYTFYEDREGWDLYARRNIEAGLEVAGGKPVYGVMWPLYHDSSDRKYQLIEESYIRMQLEVMKDAGLHGVIIWTRSNERQLDWNGGPPWWNAVREFIREDRG